MSQDIEESLMKQDIKRQRLNDARDGPAAAARLAAAGAEPALLGRRTKMMLPAPQVRRPPVRFSAL